MVTAIVLPIIPDIQNKGAYTLVLYEPSNTLKETLTSFCLCEYENHPMPMNSFVPSPQSNVYVK